MTESPLRRFQDLLRALFQFDCADLDFGIYRILNHKRAAISRFIEETLPGTVEKELRSGRLGDQAQAAEALQEVAQRVHELLGPQALDPDGNLDTRFAATPLGAEYHRAQRRARAARDSDALAAEVFNHLYAFFSRYYEAGDFISKRRYSREHRYAIPYNGEEVLLHWANADQYYIKTTDRLHDYEYRAPNRVRVCFELRAAHEEHDKNKGEKRFFVARPAETAWARETRALTIPFEYRPLTPAEKTRFASKQEKLNEAAAAAIPRAATGNAEALNALTAPASTGGKSASADTTLLAHHLRRYTRRHTSDFFIHKDLTGFLTRELDFYLKNEVLSLDVMEAGGEDRADGWFQIMRLLRSVGGEIIAFLAQIENFQKKLWEKRKFVVETNYIITLGQVPESFHAEIAANDTQWEEWRARLSIARPPAEAASAFLKRNPTLPLDTKHFRVAFADRLLASFENLLDSTDGVLVHGENSQAMHLVAPRYDRQVSCVLTDPPYNTGTDDFLFKDEYRHSCWMSMMAGALRASRPMLGADASVLIHIDANEREHLAHLLRREYRGAPVTLVWVNNLKGRQISKSGPAGTHEYVLSASPGAAPEFRLSVRNATSTMPTTYKNARYAVAQDSRGSYVVKNELHNTNSKFNEETSPSLVFNIYWNPKARSVRFSEVDAPQDVPGYVLIPPRKNNDGRHRYHAWRWGRAKIARELDELEFRRTPTDEYRIFTKVRNHGTTRMKDMLTDIATHDGVLDLTRLFGRNVFAGHAKPVSLAMSLLEGAAAEGTTLDYFAGSGTVGQAVVCLNRRDGGSRRFLLVEMGDQFQEVLVPRMKKVMFSGEWRDGRPVGT